jgi:hypothetical protein
VGRDGWFFYAGENSLDYYRSTQPFTPEQLEQWRRGLERRRDWLAARGIRYLFAVMPNKETIYPEFMPRGYNRVRPQSRLDQLLGYLREHSSVPVLDVRASLRLAKGRERLYYHTDSHWNCRGAYAAYDRIIETLAAWFPEMKPLPSSELRDYEKSVPGGDLTQMLGLGDRVGEHYLGRQPRVQHARRTNEVFPRPKSVPEFMASYAMERADAGLPRAVMYHDSFANWFVPALSEHFRRIVYVWDYNIDRALLERERPDVVIQEMVERSLMWSVPMDNL